MKRVTPWIIVLLVSLPVVPSWAADAEQAASAGADQLAVKLPGNRQFGLIFNNDVDIILYSMSGKDATAEEYKNIVLHFLNVRPGLLAQCVGFPDPVIYPSKVATTIDKYFHLVVPPGKNDPRQPTLKKLLELDRDPLTLTIEACRERGVPIVASYRMNSEDFHGKQLNMSDFAREHKDLRIPGRHCLDPIHSEVFNHRMEIFREMVTNYDVDGLEFDFRRTTHMVSNPKKNYAVLTRMVVETRKMLDEVAKQKSRERLILGVRVGPKLKGPFIKHSFEGDWSNVPGPNESCENIGLDVKTWIEKGCVDYVCPSLFIMGSPSVKEFVELGAGRDVGIYPTMFGTQFWQAKYYKHGRGILPSDDYDALLRYKNEFCRTALRHYAEGADGISTFNFNFTQQNGMVRSC